MNLKNKRHYSPSVGDIREYNVKRCKLFSSFGSLSLDNQKSQNSSRSSSPSHDIEVIDYEYPAERKSPTVEVIDDIDEYLFQNQSDEEIIENNKKYVFDLPPSYLNHKDNVLLNDEWRGRYSCKLYEDWSLVPFQNPWAVIYKHWSQWNVRNQGYLNNRSNYSTNYTRQPQYDTFHNQQYQNCFSQSTPKVYELSSHYDDEDMMLDEDEVLSNGIVEEPVETFHVEQSYPFKNRNIAYVTCRDGSNGEFNGNSVGRVSEVYDDGYGDDDSMDVDG